MAKFNPFEKFLTYEDREHVRVVNHLKLNYPDLIWTHAQNEGLKSAFEAYKTSIMGQRKGWPDFTIAHPKHSAIQKDASGEEYRNLLYLGLFIELKAPEHTRIVKSGKNAGKTAKSKGKVSEQQVDIIKRLNAMKYLALICTGADEAIKAIDNYLKK